MVCLAIYIRTLACDRQTGRRTDRQTISYTISCQRPWHILC